MTCKHVLVPCLALALTLPILSIAPSASADELLMTRIGARTDRPNSTIEARGEFQVDDAEAFLSALESGGLSAWFEYTDTVTDPGFADGDLIVGTEFSWDVATCKISKKRTSAICNDKQRRTYIKFKPNKKATPTTYKMKAYIRGIVPPLFVTPNFGENMRFVVEWTDATSGLPVSLAGIMDRCDWKRGPQRTTRHIKCPTLCGGSPLAVCGSNFCIGSPKCN